MRNGGEHAAAMWIQNRIVYFTTPGRCQRADTATRVSVHAQNLTLGGASCLFSQTINAGSQKLSMNVFLMIQLI